MKRSISILLTAFLGVSLILGGCGGSGQGAAVKDTSASAAQTETPPLIPRRPRAGPNQRKQVLHRPMNPAIRLIQPKSLPPANPAMNRS